MPAEVLNYGSPARFQLSWRHLLLVITGAGAIVALAVMALLIRSYKVHDTFDHCRDGIHIQAIDSSSGMLYAVIYSRTQSAVGHAWLYYSDPFVGPEFSYLGIRNNRFIPFQYGQGANEIGGRTSVFVIPHWVIILILLANSFAFFRTARRMKG
ncbi:MAG: hypothetical protein ABSF29_16080 [Tepidisphaeraceae bacterium]|jgi:hypothetical protein